MDRRNAWMLTVLSVVSMVWLLGQSVAGLHDGLAMLAPAILLALPLLAGRYLGERAIDRVRLARADRPLQPRRATARVRLPRPALAIVPRGGLLLAAGLATRPPPALG